MDKILYFANVRIPTEKAHGYQVMKMCENFSSLGLQIELVLPTRLNKNFERVSPFEFYNLSENFRIKKIKSFDPVFLFGAPSGFYIKVQSVLFMISLFFFLLLKRNNPESIFYTRDEHLLPLLQMFSGRVVWEGHNLPKNKDFYLPLWQNCYKIITISKGLKNRLVNLGLSEDKILISPDGVDMNEFLSITDDKNELRKKLNLPIDKKIIFYTGHLYDWKGAQVLADSAKMLGRECLVVFVGGTDKDISEFKNRNQSENILIVGRKLHEEIPYYLKAADVLVLPNSAKKDISNFYTSPIKLFEYMAAARPIVASALPSIKEILDQTNSILVEPDNPKALADGITKVLSNVELADSIAKKAFEKVGDYTWQKRAKIIDNFLKSG